MKNPNLSFIDRDKLFSHIHNDAHLTGSRYLEGMTLSQTIGSLYEYVSSLKEPSSDYEQFNLSQLTANLVFLKELVQDLDNATDAFPEHIVEKIINRVALLPLGSQFFIPGGWIGHAVLYEFEKTEEGRLRFNIYNTGDGAEYHAKVVDLQANRFHAAKSFEFKDNPNLEWLRLFVRDLIYLKHIPSAQKMTESGKKTLYATILRKIPFLEGKEIIPQTNNDLIIQGQMSGTCSQAVIECMMNACIFEADKRRLFLFNYKLDNLKEYYKWVIDLEEAEQSTGRYHQLILAAEQLLAITSHDPSLYKEQELIKSILLDCQERYRILQDKTHSAFVPHEQTVLFPTLLKEPETLTYNTSAKDSDAYTILQLREKKNFFHKMSLDCQDAFYTTKSHEDYQKKQQYLTQTFQECLTLQTALYGERGHPDAETIVTTLGYLSALGNLAAAHGAVSFQKLIQCHIKTYLAVNKSNPFLISEDSQVMKRFDLICKSYESPDKHLLISEALNICFQEVEDFGHPKIWREFLIKNRDIAAKLHITTHGIDEEYDKGVLVRHALINLLNSDKKDTILLALRTFIEQNYPDALVDHTRSMEQLDRLCTFNRCMVYALSQITESLSTVQTRSSFQYESGTVWSVQDYWGLSQYTKNTFDAAAPSSLVDGHHLPREDIFLRLESLFKSKCPESINEVICTLNPEHTDYLMHKALLEAYYSGRYRVANILNFFSNNPLLLSRPEGLFALRSAFFSVGAMDDFKTYTASAEYNLSDFFQKTTRIIHKGNPELALKLYTLYLKTCLFSNLIPAFDYHTDSTTHSLVMDSEHYKQELIRLMYSLNCHNSVSVKMIRDFYELVTSIQPGLIQFDPLSERIFFTEAKSKIQQAIQSDPLVFQDYLKERFPNKTYDTSLFPLVLVQGQIFDIETGILQEESDLIEVTTPPILKDNTLFMSLFPNVGRILRHPFLEYYEFSVDGEHYRVSLNAQHSNQLEIERRSPIRAGDPSEYRIWRYLPKNQLDGKQFIQTVLNQQHDFWLDSQNGDLLITDKQNHPIYLIESKRGCITLLREQQGGILLTKSPCFTATGAFEGNLFTETRLLKDGTIHIHLARYGLDLVSDVKNSQELFLGGEKKYRLRLPSDFIPGFSQWLHFAATNCPSEQFVLIPFKPFVIDEHSPNKSDYYRYKLDTEGKLDNGDTNCVHFRIAVDEQKSLKPSNLNEALYLMYVSMGAQNFTKALDYLKLIQSQFCHEKMDETTGTILNWMMFSLPNAQYAPQKCRIHTPESIALKLQIYECLHGFARMPGYKPKPESEIKNFLDKQWPQEITRLYAEYIHREKKTPYDFLLTPEQEENLLLDLSHRLEKMSGVHSFRHAQLNHHKYVLLYQNYCKQREDLHHLGTKVPVALDKLIERLELKINHQEPIYYAKSVVAELQLVLPELKSYFSTKNAVKEPAELMVKRLLAGEELEHSDDQFLLLYHFMRHEKNPDVLKTLNQFLEKKLLGLLCSGNSLTFNNNEVTSGLEKKTIKITDESLLEGDGNGQALAFYNGLYRASLLLLKPHTLPESIDDYMAFSQFKRLVNAEPEIVFNKEALITLVSDIPFPEEHKQPNLLRQKIQPSSKFFELNLPSSNNWCKLLGLEPQTVRDCDDFSAEFLEIEAAGLPITKALQAHADLENRAGEKKRHLKAETLKHFIIDFLAHEEQNRHVLTELSERLSEYYAEVSSIKEAFAHEIVQSVNRAANQYGWSERRLAARQKNLDLDDLLLLYIRQDPNEYAKALGLSLSGVDNDPAMEYILKIQEDLRRYLLISLDFQKTQRLHSLTLSVVQDWSSDSFKKLCVAAAAQNTITADDSPVLLVFQYLENMLIRADQKATLDTFFSGAAKDNGTILQMIMGGGKSKVILPLSALLKSEGHNLTVIEVPSSMFASNVYDLNQTTQRFECVGHPFIITRDTLNDVGEMEATFHHLLHVISHREYLITTPESMQCLILKYVEILHLKPDNWEQKILWLDRILRIFKYQADFLIDEVDTVTDVKKELNFVLGKEKSIPQFQAKWVLEVYRSLENHDPEYFKRLLSGSNVNEESRQYFIDALDQKNRSLIKLYERYSRDAILSYLNSGHPSLGEIGALSYDDKEFLTLLREELDCFLPLTLGKRNYEHYGISKTSHYAIPYKNSMVPKEGSKFGNYLTAINCTIQMVKANGVPFELIQKEIEQVLTLAEKDYLSHLSLKGINDSREVRRFKERYALPADCDLKKMLINPEQYNRLYQQLAFHSDMIHHVLDTKIFPTIPMEEHYISCNAAEHLIFLEKSKKGCTGTTWNYRASPLHLAPGSNVGSIGEIKAVMKEKNTSIIYASSDDLLTAIERNQACNALIDVGGWMRSHANLEAARKIALVPRVAQTFTYVFFYHDNVLSAISTNSADTTIYKVSDLPPIAAQHYFTFYDQSHTYGGDILQPSNAHALITVEQDTLRHQFDQGVLRLRGYLDGQQTVTVLAPLSMNEIQNIGSLYDKLTENEHACIIRDNFTYALQSLHNAVKNDLFSRLLAIPSEHAVAKQELFKLWEQFFITPVSTELQVLYPGVPTAQDTELLLKRQAAVQKSVWIDAIKSLNLSQEEQISFLSQLDGLCAQGIKQCSSSVLYVDRNTAANADVAVENQLHTEAENEIAAEIENETELFLKKAITPQKKQALELSLQNRSLLDTRGTIFMSENFCKTTQEADLSIRNKTFQNFLCFLDTMGCIQVIAVTPEEISLSNEQFPLNAWVINMDLQCIRGHVPQNLSEEQTREWARLQEQVLFFSGNFRALNQRVALGNSSPLWCMEETQKKLEFLTTTILPFQWHSPLQQREYQRFAANDFSFALAEIMEQEPKMLPYQWYEPFLERSQEEIKQEMNEKLVKIEQLQHHLKHHFDEPSIEAFMVYANIHSHLSDMAKNAGLLDDLDVKNMLEKAALYERQAIKLKNAYSGFKLAAIRAEEISKTFADLDKLFDMVQTADCDAEEILISILVFRTQQFLKNIEQINVHDFESYLNDTGYQESEPGKKLALMQRSLQHMVSRLNQCMNNCSENVTPFSDEGARELTNFLVHFRMEIKFRRKIMENFEDMQDCEDAIILVNNILTNLYLIESHRKFLYQDNKGKMPRSIIQTYDREISECAVEIPFFEQSLIKLNTTLEQLNAKKPTNIRAEAVMPLKSNVLGNLPTLDMSINEFNVAKKCTAQFKQELQKIKAQNENQESVGWVYSSKSH
ncbi:hypothetical protein Lsai_3169 [Legionella sainthelensi]|uniref:DUF3638 domain-containing protein n=1 Tax=Legionella sainthelensi TaxID=28087 RepID=A0A0W0YBW3_9GAMM|nr:DUF3638 domain-containing protein [Legionella sainthelensi]KTD54347.1 hypothetical protein Lsai_3169 [Legionella sainthelensi]VEH34287.1 Protein of uncharacterised function (DUF3638) [Legionella sainthelensi]